MRKQTGKYFNRIWRFFRQEKCVKIFKKISRALRIILFSAGVLLALFSLGDSSFRYGNYLLNQKQILSACFQCSAFGIHFSFAVSALSSLLFVFCACRPPKGFWFCFLLWLAGLLAILFSSDMLSFSLDPALYRLPGEVIVYGVRIREDFIITSILWLYALQVYLKPPLRRYALAVSIPIAAGWMVWVHFFQPYPYY